MQAPNNSDFVDQIFNCSSPMETDFSPSSTIRGLNSQNPGAWIPFNQVPDPIDHSEVSRLGWGAMKSSPLGDIVSSAEIDPGNLVSSPPMCADITKATDSSFAMDTLNNILDFTNHSSVHSMMVDGPEIGEFDQIMESMPPQKNLLTQVSMNSHSGISAQCDEESRHYGAIFASASPWDPPSSHSNLQDSSVRLESVHRNVQEFEQIVRSGGLKSQSCSLGASPSSDPTPVTSPDTRIKIKAHKDVAPHPKSTPECEAQIYERSRTDIHPSARYPVVDGNNSDDENYNGASDSLTDLYYQNFINEINHAHESGTLHQSSPRKLSTNSFMGGGMSRDSTNSYARIFNRKESITEMHCEDSYEELRWDVPDIQFDNDANVAGTTDTAMEECEADASSRAHVLHPSGSQPYSAVYTSFSDRPSEAPLQPGPNDAAEYTPIPIQPILNQINHNKVETPLIYKGPQYIHLPSGPQPTQELGFFHFRESHQNWQSDPNFTAQAGNTVQNLASSPVQPVQPVPTFASCGFGSSTSPLEGLSLWNTADHPVQGFPEIKGHMPSQFKTAFAATQPGIVSRQSYQYSNNAIAYNGQYQDSNGRRAIPSNVTWNFTPKMSNGFPANIVSETCSRASYLVALHQAPASFLPIQRRTLQNPSMATATSFEAMDIFPDELFSDLPRATEIPTNGITSLSNMVNIDSCQRNFIPRSYFGYPNYLGPLENNLPANNQVQQIGKTENFLVDTELQALERLANELELAIKQNFKSIQAPQAPQALETPQVHVPIQQQMPVAPEIAQEATATTQTSSALIRPGKKRRASKAKPRRSDKFRVWKPRTKQSPGTHKKRRAGLSPKLSKLITEKMDQAIQEESTSTVTVQEPRITSAQQPRTTEVQAEMPETPNGQRSRKSKTAFNYDGVTVPHQVITIPRFQNVASNIENYRYKSQLVCLNESGDCPIIRTKYQRNTLAALQDLHDNVVYEKNEAYGINQPYQSEFTRTELDPDTKHPMIETRSALCAYCEEISFFELKTSRYSHHMNNTHGIYSDNYLTPDPLFSGTYKVSKKPSANRKTQPRIRNHEGVVCPVCFEVVEIQCWSSISVKNPLGCYLKHFKENHRGERKKRSMTPWPK